MKRRLLIVVLALAVVGIIAAVLVYVFVYNKPQPDYATEKADYELEARSLFDEFRNNPQEAAARYNGKVLAVKGSLSSVETSDSLTIAVFAIEEGMFGDEGIRFAFIPGKAAGISSVTLNTEVTIKGYCTGFNDTDVILEHCTLVGQ